MAGTPTATTAVTPAPVAAGEGSFTVFLQGRPVAVNLTRRARRAAESLPHPLVAEMELFFSCLLRKRLRYYPQSEAPASELGRIGLHAGLSLQFRPIVAEVCNIDQLEGTPPVRTMPAQRADAFIPRWVNIDHRAGDWIGEFGY